jgi:putative NADH-flavin reductase
MKLVIFGSTGGTGLPLVKQALDKGHKVVAFVRTPSKMPYSHDNLTLVQGDAMNLTDIEQAITPDTDAVISVLAPTKNSPSDMLPRAAQNIIDTMKNTGVQRLIYMSGAGVRVEQDEPGLLDNVIRFALKTMAGDVLKQSELGVEKVKNSGLNWTVVRAPMLTDAEHSGDYRVGWVGVGTGPRLSRADAADFILSQLEEDEYMHLAPVVSN